MNTFLLVVGVHGKGKVRRQCTYPVKWIPLLNRRWIRNHRWQAGQHGQRHRVGSNEQVREQNKSSGYYGTLSKGKEKFRDGFWLLLFLLLM